MSIQSFKLLRGNLQHPYTYHVKTVSETGWAFLLIDRILTHFARIGVIGLGYVGLPLAVLAGLKGYSVVGVEQDRERIDILREGLSYVPDIADGDLQHLLNNKRIELSDDYVKLSSCDVIVICVPTPLTTDGKPDYSCLVSAATRISAVLQQEQLVIVESTVAPGTTQDTILPILQDGGMTAGKDFFVSYSPERLDPGNIEYSLSNIPKLVAGLTPSCQSSACFFYESLGLTVVPVRSIAAAEMAKLLENTYRDVNIALVNEMAQVCRRNNIDIWEVVEAASSKPFGFQAFYPGPGVGGHCVPVDSVYYTSWARASGKPAELAEKARRINASMPQFVAGIISEALAEAGKTVAGSKILVLGMTYKKDTNDARESPVIKLVEHLKAEGATMAFHDPFVEKIASSPAHLARIDLNDSTVSGQDCVVLAVAHSVYNLSWLYSKSSVVVDLTNALAAFPDNKLRKL
jgi:UDP-N-acetyl-D-glucosamine dehydrogenase